MKKIFTLFVIVFAVVQVQAQYSQNFDSFAHGTYIGVQDAAWSTWSGATGTSEDAKIDSNQAASPSNAIYFMSTAATGGPQDVVLDFGGAFNTGTFEFKQKMFIPNNKGSYFNFQAESAIGTTWSLNCNFINDSIMYIDDVKNVHVTTSYPVGTWFEFKLMVNLNTNVWELYIDNTLKGSWQNDVNKIASIDYFPMCSSDLNGNTQAEFWIDDVYYMHTPYTLPLVNAGVVALNFKTPSIAGGTNEPVVVVRNLGTTTITAVDIEIDYNGSQIQKTVTGLSIASLGIETFIVTPPVTVVSTANVMTATITDVNGTVGDDDSSDDSKVYNFSPIIPAAGKMVIVEEATGTWCGWCPRGAVALEFLAQDYQGFAQGIAVHNGDPMKDTDYDTGFGTIINGYPSATVDRGNDIDPGAIWSKLNENLEIPPAAFLVNGAQYNASNNSLEVSITADFKMTANSNWKMACVIVEDSVTGTGSTWNQSNSYSGGASGDLLMPDGTNWASLPGSVPAAQMVYNHVARAISPSFEGCKFSFPATVALNDVHTLNFSFTLDASWDTSKMHIVGMLIRPDGSIDNGSSTTIQDAVTNGFVPGVNTGITDYFVQPEMSLYPNPVSDAFTIQLGKSHASINVEIRNNLGQLISSEIITNPNSQVQMNLEGNAGIYFVKVTANNGTQRIFKVIKI